jgi:RNase P subunit RPR2
MVKKKKICNNCNNLTFIYKSIGVNKYCKNCSMKLFPIKKISKIGSKRKKQNDEYSKLRKLYLDAHPFCEANLPGVCTSVATDIHHLYSGKNRNKYYLDDTTWKAICRNCHIFIHDKLSAEEAIELNLKKNE